MKGEGEKKILIVAGETSGDLHGAHLVKAAMSLDPSLRFYGIGGKHLRNTETDVIFDSSDVAVVGIVEVFSKLMSIYRAFRWLKKSLDKNRKGTTGVLALFLLLSLSPPLFLLPSDSKVFTIYELITCVYEGLRGFLLSDPYDE